jgi:hypothetical protein
MRTYVIINSSDVSSVNFNEVVEDSSDTLRYSLDGTKTFVKFEGDTPSFLIGEPQYTNQEIIDILSGPSWTPDF